jgi:hypothetical protein
VRSSAPWPAGPSKSSQRRPGSPARRWPPAPRSSPGASSRP